MYIRNNTLAVIFRVIFIIVCGAGIVMKLMSIGFAFNTVLSDFAFVVNTLALVYFAYLIIARPVYERGALRGAVTIYMIVIFIVYYFVYFGASVSQPYGLSVAGYLLYFVSPVMAVFDYILFCRKGEFTAYSPAIWTLIPVLFNFLVFAVNKIGLYIQPVPYFNLMGMNMVVTLFMFLGISYLLFVVDNMMAGRRK